MKMYLKIASIPMLMGVILACNFTFTAITPEPSQSTEAPVNFTAPPDETQIPTQEPANGTDTAVSYFGTSFTIPSGLATGTQNDIVPQSNDFMVWPAHTRFILQGYPLQDRAFEPQVLIYPTKEFVEMSPDSELTINNLQNILMAQRTSPAEPIPFLPFQHASQVFHAQEKFLAFKNGTGIRYITQYDQAPLPINNTELFYTFQGLTGDGDYYVSIIMPVNLPYLPADNTASSSTPPDGVPFEWEDFAKFPEYLNAINDRLNHADNPFNPSLETLDGLVQTLQTFGQK